MNKNELRKKLNQPYKQQEWKDVVEFVFPHFSEFAGDQDLPIEPKDQNIVESFKQLGQVRLADGKNLVLFELKLKENVNIIRNRVKLNDIVSSYIDQEQFHGVLSIFEQGKDDYRFTFAARASEFDEDAGDFVNKKTDTKRFTYVLGKNESCRTAAERFYQLSEQKDKADIGAIENAFSVETLSKKFFKEYKEHYTMFVEYLTQTPSYYTAVFKNEDKAIRDFVKLLLGRLVFIKFVQKKGWLGVPASEQGWDHGNYRFIEDSFDTFKHQDNFYSQFLNPLFFEGFDQPDRPNDVFASTNYKIPFLSGGLFDNEDPKTKTINFPKAYFESLFEFLERYNFMIDENDTSMDREVGIDPEMLGHIFENLLEDNKDKGAFYTPKEIVRYMCQESLKEYLKTYLQEQNQWPKDEAKQNQLEEVLHKFVTLKEAAGIIDLDAALAKALKTIKICDPAIGSGAFPMGLLKEIFQLVHKLYEASPDKVGDIWEMQTWQPDSVKLNIIQRSIYGVDIEKGAVDIARLRFWLSLVVDSKEPQALPHLDYKIVVGDSLVSKLEDTIIDIDWDLKPKVIQTDIFGNEGKTSDKRLLIEEITALQKQIFDPASDDKALSLKIKNKKIDLLILQLEIMIDKDGMTDKPQGNSRQIKAMTEKWLETKGWKQQIEKLKKMKQGAKTPLEFFDWKLDFPEVMNEQITDKVGFDIIIANPPYLGEKGNKNVFRDIKKGALKEYYKSKMDMFYFFFHLGINNSKSKGIITFITTNYYITADGAIKLRETLSKETRPIKFINFNEFKIFDSAIGQHNIISIFQKGKSTKNTQIYNTKCSSIYDINKLNKILLGVDIDTNYFKTDNIFDGDNYYIRINNSNKTPTTEILNKIKRDNKLLDEFCEINSGCDITLSKVSLKHILNYPELNLNKGDGISVLSPNELELLNLNNYETSLVKEFIKNSNIEQYSLKENEDKLLYIDWVEQPEKIPNFINHLSSFKKIAVSQKERYVEPTWPWFSLHRPRNSKIFESKEKILVPYRSKKNTFAFSDKPIYSSRDVFYITLKKDCKNVGIKYLLGILNSNLMFFWLNNRGKKKGDTLELYVTPLSEIPIKTSSNQKRLIELVDKILKLKKSNQDSLSEEQQIDNLVYKLYNLTYAEVLIIEPEFSERMSKSAYEVLEVE
jgi:hypothetical protein